MKAIIDGKRFDTETARLVDSAGRYRGNTAEDLWINAG